MNGMAYALNAIRCKIYEDKQLLNAIWALSSKSETLGEFQTPHGSQRECEDVPRNFKIGWYRRRTPKSAWTFWWCSCYQPGQPKKGRYPAHNYGIKEGSVRKKKSKSNRE